ncbi:hypothetical protein [Flavobacterium sp.]|uniref:hypothetical protein n=1 Tax=Flavobacterium sp. TaxID=239 RepID=UPI003D10BC9A
MANVLKDFGEQLEKNIPGFIAISILDIYKGINYYSKSSKDSNYDIDQDSNYILEMVRARLNGIAATQQDQKIDDITITLTSQFHIINISGDHNFMFYLVVDATEANLTMTKALLQKYKKEISI